MARLTALIALCVCFSACGGTDASPTSAGPISPGVSVFSLIGTVIGYDGPVVGASVTIMDGIHAGQTRTTNAAGNFGFADLAPSAFTLQAAAMPTEGYLPQNQAVNLAANQSVTFYLSDH